MRRAARTDANHAQIVAALRKIGCEVEDLSRVGRGVPDLVVKLRFRLVFMEVKRPGGKLNALQAAWHARWAPHVVVVESPEQAIAEMVK